MSKAIILLTLISQVFQVVEASADVCIPDGQCAAGTVSTCCSGKATDTLLCVDVTCPICKKLVNYLYKTLPGKSCDVLIAEGVALCEVIGFGPEDPLADICAASVVILCPIIAKDIINGVAPDANKLCRSVDMCGVAEKVTDDKAAEVYNASSPDVQFKRCGCFQAGACCIESSDCCSGNSHHTLKCPAAHRCD